MCVGRVDIYTHAKLRYIFTKSSFLHSSVGSYSVQARNWMVTWNKARPLLHVYVCMYACMYICMYVFESLLLCGSVLFMCDFTTWSSEYDLLKNSPLTVLLLSVCLHNLSQFLINSQCPQKQTCAQGNGNKSSVTVTSYLYRNRQANRQNPQNLYCFA